MDTIDLDAIILHQQVREGSGAFTWQETKEFMKEAIHQALVLASEKAKAEGTIDEDHNVMAWVDKQSILDITKLIK